MTDHPDPLPLTIISGYLGAGKTTLINHLLRHAGGRRLVVLVNDFGELPIDADLIESQDGSTLNLANGCVCCSMGGDLFNALVEVLERSPRPDQLLIEASGVADPARIANIARAEPDLQLDSIISLVDGENFNTMINDPLVGETISHQLATADIILINKLDLIEQAERQHLTAVIDQIAAGAQKIETEFSRVPADLVLGVQLYAGQDEKLAELSDTHTNIYVKWSTIFEYPIDRSLLETALDNMGRKVLRLKGIVYLTDSTKPHVLHCVGDRCTISASTNPAIKKNNQSRLVAIGLASAVDPAELDKLFGGIAQQR